MTEPAERLTLARTARAWWPLAFSWLLMGAELPALSAFVARLPEARTNLAAYSGIVFPIALIIESPIIMLLSASVALCKDWASYRKVWNYMMLAGGVLTALHLLIAFTPLYYVVARGILGAPEEIVEPARAGLMIMTPWTWSIAYRRFNQGVMIRFGHSRSVAGGTLVRLTADLIVLFAGLSIGTIPGIIVAATAVAAGVVSEALYVGIRARSVIQRELRPAPPVEPALTYRAFFTFYMPLVLTGLLSLLAQPIGSAALSRMPEAVASLATWSVLNGLVYMVRALGLAFNEVVVALLDEPGSRRVLWRFTRILALTTSGFLLLLAATPLSRLWFQGVSALAADLAVLALTGIWIAMPMPALSALQSWYQGALLYTRQTRGITESVAVFLGVTAAILVAGIAWRGMTGLYIGVFALVVGTAAQTLWLGVRAKAALRGSTA